MSKGLHCVLLHRGIAPSELQHASKLCPCIYSCRSRQRSAGRGPKGKPANPDGPRALTSTPSPRNPYITRGTLSPANQSPSKTSPPDTTPLDPNRWIPSRRNPTQWKPARRSPTQRARRRARAQLQSQGEGAREGGQTTAWQRGPQAILMTRTRRRRGRSTV